METRISNGTQIPSLPKVPPGEDSVHEMVRQMRCPKCGCEESIDFGQITKHGRKPNRVHFHCGSYSYRSGGKGWTSEECSLREENRNLRNELECQLSNIAGILDVLGGLVKQHEDWNESVQKIIGRPVVWNDSYLDAARHILSNVQDEGSAPSTNAATKKDNKNEN